MSGETKLNNGKADIDKILSIKGVRDYYDDGDLDKKEFDKLYQKLLNNQAIVEKLAKMFRKLYDETDCSTTLSLHDVNMMIRHCFDFEGDNLETGELILNLTKHSGGSSNA